jgi:subtilisin family serine protease
VKRPTLLLAALAAACVFAGSASAAGNPLGVAVVRFSPQTSPEQMRSQVEAAGGAIVADLSAIDALAVVPRARSFDARLTSSGSVRALFPDTLIAGDGVADNPRGGGRWNGQGELRGVGLPDPWHALFQWDDDRMDVDSAWRQTTGDDSVAVAVLDTGVQASHRELRGVVDTRLGGNYIPCDDLKALFGLGYIDRVGLRDCRDGDFEGHGTWVASRIAGALNGLASNGVAPGVRIGSYKVLAAGLGGLSTWILSGLLAGAPIPGSTS